MMSDDGLDDALNLTLDVKLFARNYWKTTKKGEGRVGQKLHDVQHPTNPKEPNSDENLHAFASA